MVLPTRKCHVSSLEPRCVPCSIGSSWRDEESDDEEISSAPGRWLFILWYPMNSHWKWLNMARFIVDYVDFPKLKIDVPTKIAIYSWCSHKNWWYSTIPAGFRSGFPQWILILEENVRRARAFGILREVGEVTASQVLIRVVAWH